MTFQLLEALSCVVMALHGSPSLLYSDLMQRGLASLIVILMTFALVARGMAAPMIHMDVHGVPVQAAPVAVMHGAHAASDADRTEIDGAPHMIAGATAHSHDAHGQHDPGAPAKKSSKICDENGACCGSLAMSEPFLAGMVALPASLEPRRVAAAIGVEPVCPNRPPNRLFL